MNLLGLREPTLYGRQTLQDINDRLQHEAEILGVSITCHQSNHEGELVSYIHSALNTQQGLLINAGAYTHTSIAIRDAISGIQIPTVEVHLSNIYQRESFRHHSYIAAIAIGQITGFGAESYRLGLHGLVSYLRNQGIGDELPPKLI